MTPPWHTATTRSPGCAAMISSSVSAMRARKTSVDSPPKLSQRPSIMSSSRGSFVAAQLLHRDVVVGLRVVLDEPVDDLDVERRATAAIGSAVSTRSSQRARQDASTRSCASQSARRSRLLAAARGQAAGSRAHPCPARCARARRAAPTAGPSAHLRHRTAKPSSASSSASASSGSATLIVAMPISRAGLRLMPRSSRNTASDASTSRRARVSA